jgi:hypothetical protein
MARSNKLERLSMVTCYGLVRSYLSGAPFMSSLGYVPGLFLEAEKASQGQTFIDTGVNVIKYFFFVAGEEAQ